MKRLLSVILALCPLIMFGQNNDWKQLQNKINSDMSRSSIRPSQKPKTDSLPSSFLTVNPTAVQKTLPDLSKGYYAECYHKIVNQYGFWKGIGHKLTKEDMQHTNVYYRLLRRVGMPAGTPFEYMQIVDSYGELTTNHSYEPHLFKITLKDSVWKEKLEKVCQVEKIARNGMLVQENYFDADGKLILQYHPVSIAKNHIIGHYTDAYGAFAKLSKLDGYDYISIWLDENGYEQEIAIVDENGYLKPNDDESFILLRKHDKDGNLIRGMSADAFGNPMTDNWGNCGWEATYDKEGNQLTNIYLDREGKAMRIPRKKTRENACKILYSYDKWGNMLSKSYYDKDHQKDTIIGGIHRYLYTYNDRGKRTSCQAEGLDGKLVDFGKDYASWENRYDEKGNNIYAVYRNQKGRLCSDGECIFISKFKDGEQILREKYKTTNGMDSVLTYRKVVTALNDTTWYYDENVVWIVKKDKEGRTVRSGYYNLSLIPIEPWGYHCRIDQFTDMPHYSIQTQKYLDREENLVTLNEKFEEDHNIIVMEVDSVKHTKTYSKYVGQKLLDKWGYAYDEDFIQNRGLISYDSLGFRGRTFKAESFYYKANSTRNEQGNNIIWSGENEFGEPSYIQLGDWNNALIYCTSVVGSGYYYNENNDTIPTNYEKRINYKDGLYKSFCIELIDSAAYRAGLRTGDLIVRYGDWQYPVSSTFGRYWLNLLCYESVRKATEKKPMVVMRHDPLTRTSKLIELTMPEGTPRQIGFLYHMLYMTSKERARYDQTTKAQHHSVHLDSFNTTIEDNEEVHFVFPYKMGSANDKNAFMKGFQDNAIVLAWEPYKNGRSDLFKCYGDEYRPINNAFNNKCDSIALYYTVDGKTILRRVFNYDFIRYGVRRSSTEVSDASAIYALADSVEAAFLSQHPVAPSKKGKKSLPMADRNDIFDNTRHLQTFTVTDKGQFRDKGLSGTFIVLSLNDWYEGDPHSLLAEAIKDESEGKRHICMAQLLGDEGNYSMGPIQAFEFTTEWLGVTRKWSIVPDSIFYKVIDWAQQQKQKGKPKQK